MLTPEQIEAERKKYGIKIDAEKTPKVETREERLKRFYDHIEQAKKANPKINDLLPKKSEQQPEKEKPKSFLRKIGDFLTGSEQKLGGTYGTALATRTKDFKSAQNIPIEEAENERKIVDAIISNEKAGKDSTRLREFLAQQKGVDIPTLEEQIPALKKTAKQVAGESIAQITKIATLGKSPLSGSVLGRIGTGTAIGTASGVSSAMERDEDAGNIVKSGVVSGTIGLLLSSFAEGIFAGARQFGKNTYNKELQPPKKDLVKQIENNWKTFGEQVRSLKDESGKYVYQGGYNNMKKQAEEQLAKNGEKLTSLLKKYDNLKIYKGDVAKDITGQMENTFGKLSPAQIKSIQFEMNRIPNSFTPAEALKYKRMYDGLIPDSFWTKAGDANVAFNTQVKYILRDGLRESINNKIKDNIVTTLNNNLSIAMDMRHLTSEQIAIRTTEKISSSGGVLNKIFGKIWDDVLFNPALTTRVSQAIQGFTGDKLKKAAEIGAYAIPQAEIK